MNEKTNSNHFIGLIVSIVVLLVGITLIVNPIVGMEIILIILGAAMIAYGVINILMNFRRDGGAGGVFGAYTIPVVLLVLGILLIVFRVGAANFLLPLIIGVWAIVQGIINLADATNTRRDGGSWQAKTILAIITVALGAVILIAMAVGGNAVGTLLGIFMIIFGIVGIVQWATGLRKTDARHAIPRV